MFLLSVLSVALAVPAELTHTGRLLDGAGLPINGAQTVTVSLHDAETGGSVVWSETSPVDFDNGYYTVVLGSDSLGNPLEDTMLETPNLWVGLDVNGSVLPDRHAVNSVPYARMAGTATSVVGGIVDVSEIRVDGNTVIDAGGFSGDNDTLASLTCAADSVALFDGTSWGCAGSAVAWNDITGIPLDLLDGDDDTDTVLAEADVETFIVNGALDFDAGSTLGGANFVTSNHPTLSSMPCADQEILRWDGGMSAWTCSVDLDTDTDTIYTDADALAAVATADLYVQNTGDTMTGGLDVTGGLTSDTVAATGTVQIGDGSAVTCAAGLEGTVRYEAGRLEYCDGSGWVAPMDTTFAEPASGQVGNTSLYHFALRVPGAVTQGSPSGGNAMMFCSPMTDDNEPAPIGLPHSGDPTFEGAYISGFSSDVNGHCLSGDAGWAQTDTCVSLLVTNWEANSHEGFGAWCRTNTGTNGTLVWAQINVATGQYWNSSGTDGHGEAIAEPVNVGDVECNATGSACVARVR